MSSAAVVRASPLGRLFWPALIVGVAALIACIVGAFFDPAQFFRAYLAAYVYVLGLSHGCFLLVTIYHLTGGAWGFLLRRILEAGMRTLPLVTLLFIPIATPAGLVRLYPWAQPEWADWLHHLQHKEVYLNPPFFWGRAALYFIVWNAFAFVLDAWSRRQDEVGDPLLRDRLGLVSGLGLTAFGITITFAAVDWLMSIQPADHSSIFAPWLTSGELLTSLAFALVILAALAGRPPLAEVCSEDAVKDEGSLLFSFLIIWAYMIFFQFMLTWIANLPTDALFFLPRAQGGWYVVNWIIFCLEFVVPFFLLLQRPIKRNPWALGRVAGLILAVHWLYAFHQVMPPFDAPGLTDHWMDFLTPLALGGLWLAFFLWQLGRRPLLLAHDPNEESARTLRHKQEEEHRRERELQ